MVEQLGMARRLTGCPEVVGRRDQSATEQMQPDAVDHDAGGERVLRRRQPVRQLEPAAPLTDFGDARGDHLHDPTRHELTRLVDLAPLVNRTVQHAFPFTDSHRQAFRSSIRLIQSDLALQRRQAKRLDENLSFLPTLGIAL